MTIKVLIADDESLARDELKFLLSQLEDIEVIGEAKDGEEALEKILELEPDVAFLDIQMPNMDGLTVAKKCIKYHSKALIVFATAYDQHAIQAFEINAIDYLLKPFDEERIYKTIERIRSKVEQNPNQEMLSRVLQEMIKEPSTNNNISKLAVQKEESVILLDPNDIIYVYREEREVFVKTYNDNYTVKYSLQVLEEKLAKYTFFRTHRSYLVNLQYVQEMIPWFNGAYNLIMKDHKKTKVPVSRAYVKPLKEVLEL